MAKNSWRLFMTAAHVYLGISLVLAPQSFADEGDRSQRPYPRTPNRPPRRDEEDLEDPNQAALLAACELETPPSGEPFKVSVISKSWEWGRPGNRINHYRFSRSAHLGHSYTNPLCELIIMQKLSTSEMKAERCRIIKDSFVSAYQNFQQRGGGGSGSNVLDSFFADSRGGSDDPSEVCAEHGDETEYLFACSYLSYRTNLEASGRQKAAADRLWGLCANELRVDMRPRLGMADYNMMAAGGIDVFGSGYCGNRGGPIILQQQESKFTTAVNGLLGAFKIGAPIWAMWSLGKMHQQNAASAIRSNERLGFPSMVTAGGGMAGFAGGGGYGGFGYGGCGGAGGGFAPYGSSYGNCGINAGMGGFLQGGVMMGGGGAPGGICGVPPYAPWAGGHCNGAGGGFGGGFYGAGGVPGGMMGAGYPWNGGGLGGFGAGAGWGNPFAGPTGTIGGTNGWGGPGQMPGQMWGGGAPGGMLGGQYGSPFGFGNGAIGANPFLGPTGTIGGTNGWGNNPWASNGMYGSSGYAGNGAFNAQLAQAQAQMYQEYAARLARQAQQQSQAEKAYQQSLTTYQEAYQKSYQAYMAYQMANMGYSGSAAATLGSSGSLSGYGLGLGNSSVPSWYPPNNSTWGSGRGNWSLNFNAGNIR